ncbi:MAG: thiamine pyrophosphate-dependent enzyme [Deltaproteobacteria bacterium]|nr:thiamine pyrophosphate-dependent enzyme [Deltaproteobacteria bacterium]
MTKVLASAQDPMFGLFRVIQDDATLDPAYAAHFSDALLERMYREVLRLRVLDERMLVIQRQGRIGFYGEVKGQEATPIATGLALEADDWIFPALREGAAMLVRGFDLSTYIAQCYGNSCDVNKGRQMPSHYSGRAVNQVSWSSCIGPQVPQAVGVAWAMKLQKKPQIAVGFLGDGATSQADFHNAMNFAAVFKVPCVIICQNNHWAISVPSKAQTAAPTFASKAIAYGMPGVRVDGNDVCAVYWAIREAAARARRGEGPTFIESVTYRIGAHSSSDDPSRYRDEAEVQQWRERDPLDRMRRVMSARGLLTEGAHEVLAAQLDDEIKAAIAVVEQGHQPQRESIFEDVYASLPWHLREQREELLATAPAVTHGGATH